MRQDTEEKLKNLGRLARFDTTGIPQIFNPRGYLRHAHFIYPAVGFKSFCVNLFKVLQTNLCKNNCFYCANRCLRDCPRFSFEPKELSNVFF